MPRRLLVTSLSIAVIALLLLGVTSLGRALLMEGRDRLVRLIDGDRRHGLADLDARLSKAALDPRNGVHLRIHKREATLEIWIADGLRHRLFSTLPICRFSGRLGPKLKEGDNQAPEGFFIVDRDGLNPNSAHHLSMNLGFPTPADHARGRTGSFLMIHGGCLSVGCYAMTDSGVDEIYSLAERSIAAGKPVPVHVFPFRMTEAALAENGASPWAAEWAVMAKGWRLFEETGNPPPVSMCGSETVFERRHGCLDPAGRPI
jgi:murein L,D-transpeptidase YafK